ncbi:ROK family protein [Brachybacterium sp. AOP43-C2-M15]|uniref:ROK family protein n=1 Tax=Brachybacterium sp. AOP43-C2-M15 TaxID=3457661 RepID=UPI004033F768
MHRAELARWLDVSRTTVTKTVNELLDDGVLVVLDDDGNTDRLPSPPAPAASPPGRLKRKLGLNPLRTLLATAVFRIDRFEITLGAADGRLLATRTEPLSADAGGEERLEQGRAAFRGLLREHSLPVDAVRGFYVAVNAQIDDDTGEVPSAEASTIWFGSNVKRTVADWAPNARVHVDNTARLSALAEYLSLPSPRPRSLVYVELTWGIGMGLVKDGMSYGGGHGGAGEIGHMSLDHRGELCGCGNRGCLQGFVGMHAVLERGSEVLGREVTDVAEIGDLATGDDPRCRALVREIGEDLGAGLVTVCNLLDPNLVVLGGELTRLGPGLATAAERVIRRRALPLATRSLDLRIADLSEDMHSDSLAALWMLRSREYALPG